MRCPFCQDTENKVIDSRESHEGSVIRRRRECLQCKRRFTTYERVEELYPLIVKKDGRREAFDREKIVNGLQRACEKRPVSADQLEQVVGAIERLGNAAVDIGRIVTHRLGIPRALVADLSAAEEISHRVRVREGSAMAHRALADLELPVEVGMRVVAIRRDRDWITEVDGDLVLVPGDVLFLQGAAAGIAELRTLAGAPAWEPPPSSEEPVLSDLDRAIDVLVEMKNISEVAVGLAYSALVLRDQGLAAEVNHLEDRLDEMKERLELWVLRGAQEHLDPSALRGLLHLAQAAEEIGDAAQQLVWLIQEGEELHPILAIALGHADEVVVQVPVAAGAPADGKSLQSLCMETETGFYLLAIRRGGRYLYRPRASVVLRAGDDLIATGPDEGHALLAELCGYVLIEDEETGEDELLPAGSVR